MIAPETVQKLSAFLFSLPAQIAGRLAKAVEVDRLSDGDALPHDLILDGLRPVLRQSESSRVQTPLRIFCRPFEDLLVDYPRKDKQAGAIARGTIGPLWQWLGGELLPEASERYVEEVKEAVLGFHMEAAMSHAAGFWPQAAAAIEAAIAADPKSAKTALGGDAMVGDAREIARLLTVGPEVLEIQALMKKPVAKLPDELLFALREIYNRIAAKAPEAGPYIAVIAMRRLARPWEALRLPLFVSRQSQDTLISATDMGLVGEVLFDEMDRHLGVIRGARHPVFDPDALVAAVAGFAELSLGLVKEVEMRRDGKWGQRLMKARGSAGEAMEALMERGPREVLAALPMQRGGFTGGPRAPDLVRAPDEDKRARARRYAALIVGCRPFAAAASFGAALKRADDEVVPALKAYCDELLRELRGAEAERRVHGEDYLEFAAELTGLFMSREEADLLRRRGRAALAPAAA